MAGLCRSVLVGLCSNISDSEHRRKHRSSGASSHFPPLRRRASGWGVEETVHGAFSRDDVFSITHVLKTLYLYSSACKKATLMYYNGTAEEISVALQATPA
jgi:hypothetical protein